MKNFFKVHTNSKEFKVRFCTLSNKTKEPEVLSLKKGWSGERFFLFSLKEKQNRDVVVPKEGHHQTKWTDKKAHVIWDYNILKRYSFHLAPYLRLSTLFPGNFTQIESGPTENGDLSEINTSLRGILLNKYLLKRYFITASKATRLRLGFYTASAFSQLTNARARVFIVYVAEKESLVSALHNIYNP